MDDRTSVEQENTLPAKKKWFTLKQKIAFSVAVNAFAVLSVLFFAPLEIYLGNINEFNFPFNHIWWLLLAGCVILVAVGTAVECLFPDKLFLASNAAVFALALCCYAQAMFLNGKMGTLTGENKVYGTGVIVTNLLIWFLILAAIAVLAVVLVKKKKHRIFTTALTFSSLALVAMQTVAFVSLLLSTDMSSFKKSDYLTSDGEFELASENNVIVFVLDTLDDDYLIETLERYPDMLDGLDGFTYYPDSISTHSRTYPSITYLLTGEICHFDIPYKEYINKSFADSNFLPQIYDAGTDIRLFTESPYIGESVKDKVQNCSDIRQNDLDIISIPGLFKQMLKISLYRELPYAVKPRFQYSIGMVNSTVANLPEPFIPEDDALFFEQFRGSGLSVSKEYANAFRFYHFNGAHYGYNINQYGERTENPDVVDAVRGNFYIIESYIRQMQEQGIYEDATIIITADHGRSGAVSWEELEVIGTPCSAMLVKEAGKGEGDPVQISQASVGHPDLFPTILAAYGLDYSAYGRPIYEIGEDEQRERYYYFSAFVDDDDGEIALREYVIDGDARERANWKLTGRYWDINYSQRAVSRKRLADFLK